MSIPFHEKLKDIRKSKKLTQKQVAIAINANERNYQNFDYGKNKPSLDVLIALADLFNVSLDELVGREFPKK